MQHAASHEYEYIFLNSAPLLDVRAPIEFKQGAFPTAENLPLLNDEERHRVGICYRQQGQQQAIATGHQLVSGTIKQQRIEQWIDFTKRHDKAFLYCFRGGLRSKISQQWLQEAGISIPRVEGGYKALRKYLLTKIEKAPSQFEFVLVGGLTGCRKTQLIQALHNGIDLEGAAYHRGSSFGAHALPQSSQINFENQLAIDLLKASKAEQTLLALEDEGRFIGSVDIPKNIFAKMRLSPLVVIERPLEDRLHQLLKEYIVDMEQEFVSIYTDIDKAFAKFTDYLQSSLLRIQKRLGMQHWSNLQRLMQHALTTHKSTNDPAAHFNWLKPLLIDYYDPMYTSQLNNRKDSIVFRGDYQSCQQFIIELARQNQHCH